jgi:hypothetical protein
LVLVNFVIGVIIDNMQSSNNSKDMPISRYHVERFTRVSWMRVCGSVLCCELDEGFWFCAVRTGWPAVLIVFAAVHYEFTAHVRLCPRNAFLVTAPASKHTRLVVRLYVCVCRLLSCAGLVRAGPLSQPVHPCCGAQLAAA